jgi:hypothetical protein
MIKTLGGGNKEYEMSLRTFASYAIAATAGASMLALSMGPASAFTLSSPSLEQPVASAQIDKVWWHGGWHGGGWRGGWHGGWGWRGGWGYRGWGWRGPGWGWRGGWGPGHCWRGYWGRVHCN